MIWTAVLDSHIGAMTWLKAPYGRGGPGTRAIASGRLHQGGHAEVGVALAQAQVRPEVVVDDAVDAPCGKRPALSQR